MITCFLRYEIARDKQAEQYARTWARIIQRSGGIYHGCFVPGDEPPDADHFSFPIGRKGAENTAVVLFSFTDLASYENYRRKAGADPECPGITAFRNETQCFTGYERSFLTPLIL